MSGQLIKKFFDRFYSVPLSFWNGFFDLGEIIYTENEEILKEAHAIEKYMYFILKGSAGIILWNKNNFVCTDILCEGEFLSEFLSFLTQQPTPHELRSFEKSEILKIPHGILYDYYRNSPYGDQVEKSAHLGLYIDKLTQQMNLLTLTAEEHYKLLIKQKPHIVKYVPQKYIASFLGITPQSFSRIRKKID